MNITNAVWIRPLGPGDWDAVREIYEEGIATGNATFQTTAPGWDDWNRGHLAVPRLIAGERDAVLGWAALSPVSTRIVYAGVAEVSVYIAEHARGRGIGRRLLETLVQESEVAGIWTLQAVVFPENIATIRLHTANGFRVVGRRERIGQLDDNWRDTLLLERRSQRL